MTTTFRDFYRVPTSVKIWSLPFAGYWKSQVADSSHWLIVLSKHCERLAIVTSWLRAKRTVHSVVSARTVTLCRSVSAPSSILHSFQLRLTKPLSSARPSTTALPSSPSWARPRPASTKAYKWKQNIALPWWKLKRSFPGLRVN